MMETLDRPELMSARSQRSVASYGTSAVSVGSSSEPNCNQPLIFFYLFVLLNYSFTDGYIPNNDMSTFLFAVAVASVNIFVVAVAANGGYDVINAPTPSDDGYRVLPAADDGYNVLPASTRSELGAPYSNLPSDGYGELQLTKNGEN